MIIIRLPTEVQAAEQSPVREKADWPGGICLLSNNNDNDSIYKYITYIMIMRAIFSAKNG